MATTDYRIHKPILNEIGYPEDIDNLIDALYADITLSPTGIDPRLTDVESDKANKVATALPEGNLAELDSNGDLVNSGILSAEVATKDSTIIADNVDYLVSIDNLGRIKNSGLTTVGAGLNDSMVSLTDTDITAPIEDHMIRYNASGKWENFIPSFTLSQISDSGDMAEQNKASINIDGGNIDAVYMNSSTINATTLTNCAISSLSSPLTVAQGGTGRNAVEQGKILYGNGTNTLVGTGIGSANKVLTSDGTKPYWATLPSNGGVGISQTWQLPSRVLNNQYTAPASGPPIFVVISINTAEDNYGYVYAGVSSANIQIAVIRHSANTSAVSNTVSFIVPAGHHYKVTGSANILKWAELR